MDVDQVFPHNGIECPFTPSLPETIDLCVDLESLTGLPLEGAFNSSYTPNVCTACDSSNVHGMAKAYRKEKVGRLQVEDLPDPPQCAPECMHHIQHPCDPGPGIYNNKHAPSNFRYRRDLGQENLRLPTPVSKAIRVHAPSPHTTTSPALPLTAFGCDSDECRCLPQNIADSTRTPSRCRHSLSPSSLGTPVTPHSTKSQCACGDGLNEHLRDDHSTKGVSSPLLIHHPIFGPPMFQETHPMFQETHPSSLTRESNQQRTQCTESDSCEDASTATMSAYPSHLLSSGLPSFPPSTPPGSQHSSLRYRGWGEQSEDTLTLSHPTLPLLSTSVVLTCAPKLSSSVPSSPSIQPAMSVLSRTLPSSNIGSPTVSCVNFEDHLGCEPSAEGDQTPRTMPAKVLPIGSTIPSGGLPGRRTSATAFSPLVMSSPGLPLPPSLPPLPKSRSGRMSCRAEALQLFQSRRVAFPLRPRYPNWASLGASDHGMQTSSERSTQMDRRVPLGARDNSNCGTPITASFDCPGTPRYQVTLTSVDLETQREGRALAALVGHSPSSPDDQTRNEMIRRQNDVKENRGSCLNTGAVRSIRPLTSTTVCQKGSDPKPNTSSDKAMGRRPNSSKVNPRSPFTEDSPDINPQSGDGSSSAGARSTCRHPRRLTTAPSAKVVEDNYQRKSIRKAAHSSSYCGTSMRTSPKRRGVHSETVTQAVSTTSSACQAFNSKTITSHLRPRKTWENDSIISVGTETSIGTPRTEKPDRPITALSVTRRKTKVTATSAPSISENRGCPLSIPKNESKQETSLDTPLASVDKKYSADMEDAESGQSERKTFKSELWRTINDPQFSQYVAWSTDGKSGYIAEKKKFETTKAFRSITDARNLGGFIRQLHMWGFSRCSEKNESGMSFRHDLFQRDRPDLLAQLRRREEHKHRQPSSLRSRKRRASQFPDTTVPLRKSARLTGNSRKQYKEAFEEEEATDSG